MSDDEVKVYEDVPRTNLAVRTQDQARAALVRLRGETPPNQCEFQCIMCGWRGTLELTDEEIAAVGGDVEMYGGPCPGFEKDGKGEVVYQKDARGEILTDGAGSQLKVPCEQMALVPRSRMGTDQWTPGDQLGKAQKLKDLREAAEVNAEVLVEKAADAVVGVFAKAVPVPPVPDAPPEGEKSSG